MSKFLGIDTSCYTTSLAVYDSETTKEHQLEEGNAQSSGRLLARGDQIELQHRSAMQYFF